MTVEQFARSVRSSANSRFESAQHRTATNYERELGKQQNRLRQALAGEEALRHQNDELVQNIAGDLGISQLGGNVILRTIDILMWAVILIFIVKFAFDLYLA